MNSALIVTPFSLRRDPDCQQDGLKFFLNFAGDRTVIRQANLRGPRGKFHVRDARFVAIAR